MSRADGKQLWGLIQTPRYREEYQRLPPKFRSQIARKIVELMEDPTPGGSRTSLKGYDQLCRLCVFRTNVTADSDRT